MTYVIGITALVKEGSAVNHFRNFSPFKETIKQRKISLYQMPEKLKLLDLLRLTS
jgi:hypothetical protein